MKKSSIAIIVTVLIAALVGTVYIGKSISNRKNSSAIDAKVPAAVEGEAQGNADDAGSMAFDEFSYKISDSETVRARYIKSDTTVRIFSIKPVSDKNRYSIMPGGTEALYLAKDGNIWLLYNDGEYKKITPDKYENIDRESILKKTPGYIWSYKPEFTPQGNVRFISNLPDTSESPRKSIWEVNPDDKTMKKIYTPLSDDFRSLGYRDDGRFMVLDDASIAVINVVTGSAESIDVKDKHVISLSPDGKNIIYARKDESGKVDYGHLMYMDSSGKNFKPISSVVGFSASDIGIWSEDSSQYAFILKSMSGDSYKIAVTHFSEGGVSVLSYPVEGGSKFSESYSLNWAEDGVIAVDTGDSIISVNLQ